MNYLNKKLVKASWSGDKCLALFFVGVTVHVACIFCVKSICFSFISVKGFLLLRDVYDVFHLFMKSSFCWIQNAKLWSFLSYGKGLWRDEDIRSKTPIHVFLLNACAAFLRYQFSLMRKPTLSFCQGSPCSHCLFFFFVRSRCMLFADICSFDFWATWAVKMSRCDITYEFRDWFVRT